MGGGIFFIMFHQMVVGATMGRKAKGIAHYDEENMLNKMEAVILRLQVSVRGRTLDSYGSWHIEVVLRYQVIKTWCK